MARPEMKTIITEIHNVQVREGWIEGLKQYLYVSLYVNIAIAVATLVINRARMKRKSDHKRYNLVFLTVIALAFLLVMLSY
jgi:hypothetical protein